MIGFIHDTYHLIVMLRLYNAAHTTLVTLIYGTPTQSHIYDCSENKISDSKWY